MIRDIWHFPDRSVGREVIVLHSVASTNEQALCDGREGTGYLADEQTAGRGQHGRTWTASPRSSVLLSVVLPNCIERPAILTALAAVCASEVVHSLTGIQPRIKWPNDVLLNDRKVAGILIERAGTGPFVIGIGLNVRQSMEEFSLSGLPDATSLLVAGANVRTDEVARLLLLLLDKEFRQLQTQGASRIESAWVDRLGLAGREVRAECASTVLEGRIIGIGFAGVVLGAAGTSITLAPESILHLDAVSGDDD